MSDEEPGQQGDLRGQLRALRLRARSARHGYWFLLVLFGLQTPARGYVITVAVLTGLALVLPLLSPPLPVFWPGDLVVRGTFPFLIIAAGLWALAWAERSRALAVTAAVYTATALLASLYNVKNLRSGWAGTRGRTRWT